MSAASSPAGGARKSARLTISVRTELAVLALPAVLLALLASDPVPQQAHATHTSAVPPTIRVHPVCAASNHGPFSTEQQGLWRADAVTTHRLCINSWRNGQHIGDETAAAGY